MIYKELDRNLKYCVSHNRQFTGELCPDCHPLVITEEQIKAVDKMAEKESEGKDLHYGGYRGLAIEFYSQLQAIIVHKDKMIKLSLEKIDESIARAKDSEDKTAFYQKIYQKERKNFTKQLEEQVMVINRIRDETKDYKDALEKVYGELMFNKFGAQSIIETVLKKYKP